MTEERKPRNKQSRQEEARPNDSWVPASILPDPDPVPGWTFRWIRTSTLGEPDNTHVSRMFREGWVACKSRPPRNVDGFGCWLPLYGRSGGRWLVAL